jgi:cardiolipin synthase
MGYTLYVVIAGVFITLENRSPQSTFAWLFLFMAVPVIGVIIYAFFGRGWHAFAREQSLSRQEFGSGLLELDDLQPLIKRQEAVIARIIEERPAAYKKKLLHLVKKNSSSLLTGYNDVVILQNASMKYPRLLEDASNVHCDPIDASAAAHRQHCRFTKQPNSTDLSGAI